MILDDIEQAAKEATPGRWIATKGTADFHGVTALGVGTETIRTHVATDLWPRDATYVVAVQPRVALRLAEVARAALTVLRTEPANIIARAYLEAAMVNLMGERP